MLEQYVNEGVYELDDVKLLDLIELKHKSVVDAKRELGNIKSIKNTFIGFKEYLYGNRAI